MTAKTDRIAWIDNVRCIAILCVIIGHSFSLVAGEFRGYDEINLFIVAFNMPLFALLTGITSFKSLSRINTRLDLLQYLNKVLWRIGVPTVVYTLLAMGISYGMQMRWERCGISMSLFTLVCLVIYLIQFSKYSSKLSKIAVFFPYLVIPVCLVNQSVWYLVYVLISLFTAAISQLISNKVSSDRIVFYVVFAIMSLLVAPLSPFFSTLELYLPFVIGYEYSASCHHTMEVRKNKLFLCIVFFIIGIYCFIKYYSIPNQFYCMYMSHAINNGHIDVFLLRQLSAITLSFAIVVVIQALTRSYSFVSRMGTMTLGIYAIHSEVIGIIRQYLTSKIVGGVVLEVSFVMLMTVLLMTLSVFLVTCIRKDKYLRIILLGE